MKLKIEITLDNAAFEEAAGQEVNRILSDLPERLNFKPGENIGLYDINGNHCGTAKVTK